MTHKKIGSLSDRVALVKQRSYAATVIVTVVVIVGSGALLLTSTIVVADWQHSDIPSTSQIPSATVSSDRLENAPDLIPTPVDGGDLPDSGSSSSGHPSVREIRNLSEDLVRNLENADMLENFMVLFRTIAAGHVPDLVGADDFTLVKNEVDRLPVGVVSNG